MRLINHKHLQSALGVALLFGSAVSSAVAVRAQPPLATGQITATVVAPNGNRESGIHLRAVTLEALDGTRRQADLSQVKTSAEQKDDLRVSLVAPWARFDATMRLQNGAPSSEVIVTNLGPDIIRGFDLQLMTIQFLKAPRNFNGEPRLTHNRDAPAAIRAELEGRTAFFTNDLPGRAVLFGFPYSTDKPANRTYPLIVATQQVGWLQGPNLLDPYLDRPIYPGGTDRFAFSVHYDNDGGLSQRFAAQFPMLLKWDDRRPIGMVMLSTSETQFHSPTNPRGWFNDAALDISNAADFKKRMLDRAREVVRVSKSNNAQGVIVWDLEGQEFPHATSYLGDPRSLPPESEAVADEFFQILKAGGLKVGLCIRPQRPIRSAYGSGVQQIESENPAQTLIDKIGYARKRWGATLFYVDSNGDPNVPFPAQVFEQVLAAHPDVLLIPEHQSARYYRFGAPYDELRGGVAGTPDWARELYPRAFSVIVLSDGDTKARREELVRAVRAGDVLMSRVWWDDSFNADLRSIYAEAKK